MRNVIDNSRFIGEKCYYGYTRLISHHISKGETVTQSLKDRLDYGKDPDKTQGGKLISSYECDYMTAGTEFLLSNAKYKAATGRFFVLIDTIRKRK
ncbi:hypothetical protein ACTQ33_16715 [Candidatus Avoscillospira sp. LCP25S3_F1]|uniref:hypothetical protein n=1 Tax=Candidatus Avoscillospira sp. LCP25S3_F1 TaxID=3438825 RepID=UPI003F903F2C